MAICKYYQQGRCRFGNDCRFQHSDDSSNYYDSAPSYIPRNKSQNQNDRYHYVKPLSTPDTTPIDVPKLFNQIMDIANQDMTAARRGGQWPLSCYAPLKENGPIMGLYDISPEELRWQIYNSKLIGNTEDCINQIQGVLQSAHTTMQSLTTQSTEAQTLIKTIYQQLPIHAQKDNIILPSIFGDTMQTASTSYLNASSYSASIFGSGTASAAQNLFESSSNKKPSGLFGTAAAAIMNQSSPGLFGAVATFNQPQSGNFENSFQNTSNLSALPATNAFGSSPTTINVFGLSPATNVFSSSPATTNAFGSSATANAFGSTPAQQMHTTNAFGAVGHTTSIFGSKEQNSSQQLGELGASAQQTAFYQSTFSATSRQVIGNASSQDSTMYTLLSDLNGEMLSAFKGQTFMMGKVPTKPPTREMCF